MSNMIRIEGPQLEQLRKMLADNKTGLKPYLLRIEWRGDSAAFKVNEQCWSAGLGTEQLPY